MRIAFSDFFYEEGHAEFTVYGKTYRRIVYGKQTIKKKVNLFLMWTNKEFS